MEVFDFQDIVLIPRMCRLSSRANADVSARLGNRKFRLPLMTANMPAIINESIAVELAKRDYFYVMHRTNVDIVSFAKNVKNIGLFVSISIGVVKEYYDIIDKLKGMEIVPDYITVDISHGHSIAMKDMISYVREAFGSDIFIIAGNVATPEGVKDLEDWGADAVKVGIGPGYVCTTTIKTGFGTRGWQLSAIQRCAKVSKKVIIADGGIKESGDIVKAIHMGADWIMSGYLYSGHDNTPGETMVEDGIPKKYYFGNASAMNKGCNRRVEGITTLIQCDGCLFEKLLQVEEHLQSAVSFSGGSKINDVRNVDHVILRT